MAEIFDLVRCGGYIRPVRDGRHLIPDKENPFHGWFVTGRDGDTGQPILWDVAYRGERLEKEYYTYLARPFRGVIVGFRDMMLRATLEATTEEDDGERLPVVRRVDEQIVRCAVVYYTNCRKHFVPLEHIIGKEERK